MLMQEDATVAFHPMTQCYGGSSFVTHMLWLIPALPIVVAGAIALMKHPRRKTSAALAISSLSISLLLSLAAFGHVMMDWVYGDYAIRETVNFTWIQFGTSNVDLGWV